MPSLTMAWPASGLNPCLADSIEGFVRSAARYGHNDVSFAVCFDRTFAEIDSVLIQKIKEIAGPSGRPIRLFDMDSRDSFIRDTADTADRDVLDYALNPSPDGIGYGCNVNLGMLLSAGEFLIATDDDIYCRPARSPGASDPSLRWSTDYFPGDILYCRDRQAVLDSVAETELDIFSEFKSHLGKRADALAISGSEVPPDALIMFVNPGTYGDSCMGSQSPVLNLRGNSRSRMAADYKGLRYSREIVRIPAYNALSPSSFLIQAQTGFNNTLPLPPLVTYGRNPDGLTAFLIRMLYPSSCSYFPAFGLFHSPPALREADRHSLHRYPVHLSSLIMSASMYNLPGPEISDITERFAVLGSGIELMGKMKDDDFTDAVHSALSVGLRNYAEQLEEALDIYGREPVLWAEDVVSHLESVFALLREPERMFGREGCGLSVERAQDHFRKYGRLLAVWPSLHKAFSQKT